MPSRLVPFQLDGVSHTDARERMRRVAARAMTQTQIAVDALAAGGVGGVVAAGVGGTAEHAEVGL